MEAKAIAKGVRISPIKTRLVVDLIRGKSVSDALNILNNTNTKASRATLKVVNSAVANAVNNNGANVNTLYIKEARDSFVTIIQLFCKFKLSHFKLLSVFCDIFTNNFVYIFFFHIYIIY